MWQRRFHTRTRRAISVGWAVLEKIRLDGCLLVVGWVGGGRIVPRQRKSNFDYFGAGLGQLRKGLGRPRKRVIGDFHGCRNNKSFNKSTILLFVFFFGDDMTTNSLCSYNLSTF